MVQYGCSFGLELAVDNMIGEFFHEHFGLSQTTSGMLGSIFGLMNLFSRASGGMLADYVNSLIGEGTQGRMLVHFAIFMLTGGFLVGFSFAIETLSSSIVVLILFSYCVQAACGTTFCKLLQTFTIAFAHLLCDATSNKAFWIHTYHPFSYCPIC
jgi:NNP family nitrate/nitrite transporter-like MFS transporter